MTASHCRMALSQTCGPPGLLVQLWVSARGWLIAHGVNLAGTHVKLSGFIQIERTGAAAAEHRQLVAALIDGAVAIEALGNRECRSTRQKGRDQLGRRTRRKTLVGGRVI